MRIWSESALIISSALVVVSVQCWQAAVTEDASLLQCLWCPAGGSSSSALSRALQGPKLRTILLSVLKHKLDFCRSGLDLTTNTDSEPLHLTADDCRVTSRVIHRVHSDTKTQLDQQDCEINTAGNDQLFPVLQSVQLWWEIWTDHIHTQIRYKSI